MIEGLKVTVEGSELGELCESRAVHHESRAETYAKQIVSMNEDKIEGMNYTNGDPVKTLEDRKSHHEGEAAELRFIAGHLVATEQYLLERSDLQKLGICKSRY